MNRQIFLNSRSKKEYPVYLTEEEINAIPILVDMAMVYSWELYDKKEYDRFYKKHKEIIDKIDEYHKTNQGLLAVGASIEGKSQQVLANIKLDEILDHYMNKEIYIIKRRNRLNMDMLQKLSNYMKYIIKTYPDGCAAYNWVQGSYNEILTNKRLPEEYEIEDIVEDCLKEFHYEYLGLCGCPEETFLEMLDNNIEKVIFNDPATVILWKTGGKTVVKAQDGEPYDKEKGFAMAILKYLNDNRSKYNNIIKKWCGNEVSHS